MMGYNKDYHSVDGVLVCRRCGAVVGNSSFVNNFNPRLLHSDWHDELDRQVHLNEEEILDGRQYK